MPKTATAPVITPELAVVLSEMTGLDIAPTNTIDTAARLVETRLDGRIINRRCTSPKLDDLHGLLDRLGKPGFGEWLETAKKVGDCQRPIRLHTTDISGEGQADRVIYKRCGTRRESLCPSCAKLYKYDTYQLIKAGLAGGKGVPETVTTHPAVFVTLAAPSFGPVHTRIVRRHVCADRRDCQCRAEPCHARRDQPHCPHGKPLFCFHRHGTNATQLGKPLCVDCYDHNHHVAWNAFVGELWARTTITINRLLNRVAKQHGITTPIQARFGRVAEIQARGAIHLHAIVRLDGINPEDKEAITPPPAGLTADHLTQAIKTAAATTALRTPAHPANPNGWLIAWGDQGTKNKHADVRTLTSGLPGTPDDITAQKVAGYLAKYATKACEPAGMPTTSRLTEQSIDHYADPDGSHTERLVDAAWTLAQHSPHRGERAENGKSLDPFARLKRGAHMLGFAGHFSSKSRKYSTTLTLLRYARTPAGRAATAHTADHTQLSAQQQTAANAAHKRWSFIGSGWLTTGDAALATQAANAARSRQPARFPH